MPVQIQYQPHDIYVLRFSGILKRSEFAAEQNALARQIDTGSKPRLLVILENFEGWERRADWNDLDFMISHGGKISKIAVVAELRWGLRPRLLPERGSVGGRGSFFRLTNSNRREAGWRSKPPLQAGITEEVTWPPVA